MPVKLYKDKMTPTNTAPKTPQQVLLYNPKNASTQSKWYAGEQPTQREILGRATTISEKNPEQGNGLFQQFKLLQSQPTSMFFNPYTTSTNPALKNLAELGIDVSEINDDWYAKNSYLKDYYNRNGMTNAPSAPTKKSSPAEVAAYNFYHVESAESLTQKAEQERDALRNEITYWAAAREWNLSDEEIINRIDMKKYPTLDSMRQNLDNPLVLNRSVPLVNEDWMYGAIWAARNNGGTGNDYLDQANSALKKGNVYQEDPEITAKLNKNDKNNWSPYSVGMTIAQQGLYYNRSSFNQRWIDSHPADPDNELDVDNRKVVVEAENFTQEAEKDLSNLNKWLDQQLAGANTPEEAANIIKSFKARLDAGRYPALKAMDDGMASGNLCPTTRAVDYCYNDVVKKINEQCGVNSKKSSFFDILKQNGINTGSTQSQETETANSQKIKGAGTTFDDNLTEAEKDQFNKAPTTVFGMIVNGIQEIGNQALNVINNSAKKISNYYVTNMTGLIGSAEKEKSALESLEAINAQISDLSGRINATEDEAKSLEAIRKLPEEVKLQTGLQGILSRTQSDETLESNQAFADLYKFVSGRNDWDLMGQEEKIGAIDKAKEWYNYLMGDGQITGLKTGNEDTELLSLNQQRIDQETIAEQNKGAQLREDNTRKVMALLTNIYTAAGIDTFDMRKSVAVADAMQAFSDYEATKWEKFNFYDMLMREDGGTYEEVKQAAMEGNAEFQTELETCYWIKDYIEQNDIQMPDNYMKNLNRRIQKFKDLGKEYYYFTLQGESDFKAMAEKGREMEEREKIPLADLIDGYSYSMDNPREQVVYGIKNADHFKQMTETEKDTYYYLYATQGSEVAAAYYDYIDKDGGTLQTRFTEELQQQAQEEVNSGFGGFVWANTKAILSSPLAFLSSAFYMLESAVMGTEVSPKSSRLRYNNWANAVQQASSEKIASDLKDAPVAATIVGGFYEMMYNRLRSWVMAPTGITSELSNSILRELGGAVGISTISAMDTIAEAMDNGADMGQAWIMGLVAFAGEDLTEGLTYGNIMDMFSKGGEAFTYTLKEKIIEWLTKNGFEEAIGETISDVWVDKWNEYVMGDLSDHSKRVAELLEENQGMTEQQAESIARQEELQKYIHTFIISYLSPSLDVLGSTAKQQLEVSTRARLVQREYKKNGVSIPLSDIMKEERARAEQEARAQAEQEAKAAEEEEAGREIHIPKGIPVEQAVESPVAMRRAATTEDEQFFRDMSTFDAVVDADETTQTAAITGVLGYIADSVKGDAAVAAATSASKHFGGTGNFLQEFRALLTTAKSLQLPTEQVKQAIMNVALSDSSQARQLVTSDDYQGMTIEEKTQALIGTVQADAANQTVSAEAAKAITESRIAEKEKGLIASGAMDGAKEAQDAYAKAVDILNMARDSLKEKKADHQAKAGAVSAAAEELVKNPTQDNKNVYTKSVNELQKAVSVEIEYEQHLENVRKAADSAKEKSDALTKKALGEIRTQAEQMVAEEDQSRAELAAQQEAQKKIEAEAVEAMKTEAKINNNITRLDADAFIEKYFPKATEDEKKQIRNRFVTARHVMGMTADALLERGKFAKAVSQKFGVKISVKDTTEGGKYLRKNASVNPKTGEITLDTLATTDDMMYAILTHEMTHIAETAGETVYNELADAVLQMQYGEGVTFKGVLDQIAAGDTSSKIAQDILAKRKTYDKKLGKTHSDDYLLKEIVADGMGNILAGDEDVINRFVAEKPSVARRVLETIKNFLKKMVGIEGAPLTQAQQTADLLEKAINATAKSRQKEIALREVQKKYAGTPVGEAAQNPVQKFSLDDPVQVRDDGLVAVHNLSAKNLLDDLTMGGFPMPSIAVMQNKNAWTGYGDVSVFFGRNTVDPRQGNTMYAGDAFTPTLGNANVSTADQAMEVLRKKPARMLNIESGLPLSMMLDSYKRIGSIEEARAKAYSDKGTRQAVLSGIEDRTRTAMNKAVTPLLEQFGIEMNMQTDRDMRDLLQYGLFTAVEEYDDAKAQGEVSEQDLRDIINKNVNEAMHEAGADQDIDVFQDEEASAAIMDLVNYVDANPISSYMQESKPNRIIPFSEITGVVLPNNVSDDVRQALNNIGVTNIYTYPANDNFARKMIMEDIQTSDDEIRFSLPAEEAQPLVTDSQGNVEAAELRGGTVIVDPDIKYSLSSFNEDEQERVRKALLEKEDKNGKKQFTTEQVDKYLKDALSIAAKIAEDRTRLDFKASDNQVFLKKNNDYYFTLDASTLCAKRLLYQGTFDYVQHALPDEVFTPMDLVDLVNIMSDMGYETPCGICYVESRRRWLDTYAQGFLDELPTDADAFIDKYFKKSKPDEKAAIRERFTGEIPSIDDLTTSDGLEKLRHSNPDMYKAFVTEMNAKGSANPKVVQLRTEYRGDIGKLTDKDIQNVKDIGGLRIQSFSDFETPHLLDMVQAVLDMSSRGLTSQAYTKVPNFAWVFGDTGIKINLSLIGKGTGLDENGNLVFDNREGIDFDEAMKLRERYGKNVGTILVGINDDHIIAAMGDPRVDFIIPFHRSGWSDVEMKGIPSLANYKDYTSTQNERYILERVSKTLAEWKTKNRDALQKWIEKNGENYVGYRVEETEKGFRIVFDGYKTESFAKHKERTKEDLSNLEPVGANQYWNFKKSGQWNAENYLRLCAEQHRMPKFWQFLVDNGDGSFSLPKGDDKRSRFIREGYWKTLIDFKMYDNDSYGRTTDNGTKTKVKGAEQKEVTPNINMAEAYRVLGDYDLSRRMPGKKNGEDMVVRMKDNNSVPVATDAGDKYIALIKSRREGIKPEPSPEPLEAEPPRANPRASAFGASQAPAVLGNTESNADTMAAQQQSALAIDAETGETIKLSLPELDQEYEEALAANDPDWQAQLVDQAAYQAGYTVGAYHGTNETGITSFNTRTDNDKKTGWQLLFGTHFTQNPEYAKQYAKKAKGSKGTGRLTSKFGKVYDVKLDLGKSLDLRTAKLYTPDTEMYQLYNDLPARIKKKVPVHTFSKYDTEMGLGEGDFISASTMERALQEMSPKAAEEFLIDHGYNSVLYDAKYGGGMVNNMYAKDPSIIMLDPERIKSADPITYDDHGNVIPLSQRFNPKSNDIRYSLPSDAPYLSAVNHGDMEAAQAMVDEKVEEEFADSKARTSDGRLMKLYHGTKEEFNVFDPTISGGKNGVAEGYGIYMTDNPDIAQQYGQRQISAYADIKRPAYGTKKTIKRNELTKVIKAACEKEANAYVEEGSYSRVADALPDTWISNYVYTPEYRTIDDAYKAVADSIIDQNDNDSDIVGELLIGQGIRDYSRAMEFYHDILTPLTGIDGIWQKWENPENGKVSNVILAFDSSQIKDADPVTYDDNGNVIPLSQRFNPKSNDIRYSLPPVEPVEPSSDDWSRDAIPTFSELKAAFPNMYNIQDDRTEEQKKNDTSIAGTVSTYRKIFDKLKKEGFDGTILDASSGMGLGAKAGREEFGLKVDDIEPFPAPDYYPSEGTDYSKLNKKYDVIISNAVLNVLTQDERDALVAKMGQLLNDGGRMFINVRGVGDVSNLRKNVDTEWVEENGKPSETNPYTGKKNIQIGENEYYTGKGTYQKGFTNQELASYLLDALGPGYSVSIDNKHDTSGSSAAAVVVTKNADERYRYSLPSDAPYLSAVNHGDMDEANYYIQQTAEKDGFDIENIAYHGTSSFGFTEFDINSDEMRGMIFVAYNPDLARTYTDNAQVREIGKGGKDYYNMLGSKLAEELKQDKNASFAGSPITSVEFLPQDRIREIVDDAFQRGIQSLDGLLWEGTASTKETIIEEAAQDTGLPLSWFEECNTPKEVAELLVERIQSGEASNNESKDTLAYLLRCGARVNMEGDTKTLFDVLQRIDTYVASAYNPNFFEGRVLLGNSAGDTKLVSPGTVANMLEHDMRQGIYEFYTRPGNQLVIDAEDNNWNSIPFDLDWADHMHADETFDEEWEENISEHDALDGRPRRNTRYIAKWAMDNGYDSVRINNVYDNGGLDAQGDGYGDIGIFFNREDVKSADTVTYDENGDIIPPSERFGGNQDMKNDIRYSLPSERVLDQQIQQYLMDGGNLSEEVTPPEGTDLSTEMAGSRQRQFGHKTAQESDALHQEVKDYLYNHSSYTPDSNKAQIDRAVDWVQRKATTDDPDGYYAAVNEVTSDGFDYRSADGQARMLTVMGMAALKDDLNTELRLADAYNKQGTDLGRQLQARKIFRLMTPIGRQSVLQQMTSQINDQYAREGKNTRVKLSDWTLLAAGAAETEEEFDRVRKYAAKELAEQMPANWKDKLRGWRMLSMLCNPRTHIRNVVGNALFVPVVSLKNKLGAVGEILSKQEDRTKTLAVRLPKSIRDFALEDAIEMKDVLTGEAKYNEDNAVQREQKAFKGLLQAIIDFNSGRLEAEDWHFLRNHYRRALGGWMKANGYTAEQLRSNPGLLEEGRAYATQEAKKATYRDFSKLAATLNKVSRDGGVAGFLVDAALPFKKTPANILKRGMEYSPAGIMRSLTTDIYHLKQWNDHKSGKLDTLPDKALSPNQFIDRLCSGLSGAAIMAVGALLANAGIVSCGLDDDKDKSEKEKGNQEYSIKFNILGKDYTYTIDWAAPMSMPFFVGAAIQKQLSNKEKFDIEKLVDAFGNITEPVFNLSMLDGVNSLFKTSQYDDTNTLTQIGAKIASNYATSYVPSLLGAIARTVDDTRRKSFVESGKGTGVMGTFRYAREQVENKIPGLSQTNIPYRNIWGEAETSGLAERIFENFISPGYVSEYRNDPVLNEMARLYEIYPDESSLVPKDPGKTITHENQKHILTAEEWDTYKVARGETAWELLNGLIEDPDYQEADDRAKVKMIKDAWSYADTVGKGAVIEGYNVEGLGENAVKSIAHDGKISFYESEMIKALNAGDIETYDTMVEALHELDVEDSTIKTKIGNTYRDQYKDAYRDGDTERMAEIEEILDATGYDFNISGKGGWEDQVDAKNK